MVFVQERDSHHATAPGSGGEREAAPRSGFQPYRPSEEARPLAASAASAQAQAAAAAQAAAQAAAVAHAAAPPPGAFALDPAAYSPYHPALYPPHLQHAYRSVEPQSNLFYERALLEVRRWGLTKDINTTQLVNFKFYLS